MALKNHYLPLEKPKIRFGNVEKAMCQVVARHWEHIFFLLSNRIWDLGDVEKVMFQMVANHWGLIYFLLTNLKCDLCEVEKSDVLRACMSI